VTPRDRDVVFFYLAKKISVDSINLFELFKSSVFKNCFQLFFAVVDVLFYLKLGISIIDHQ